MMFLAARTRSGNDPERQVCWALGESQSDSARWTMQVNRREAALVQ